MDEWKQITPTEPPDGITVLTKTSTPVPLYEYVVRHKGFLWKTAAPLGSEYIPTHYWSGDLTKLVPPEVAPTKWIVHPKYRRKDVDVEARYICRGIDLPKLMEWSKRYITLARDGQGIVIHNGATIEEICSFGKWIIKSVSGTFTFWSDKEFCNTFTPVEE